MKGQTASCQIVYPNVATLGFTLTRLFKAIYNGQFLKNKNIRNKGK
jgi:hypothetical protein